MSSALFVIAPDQFRDEEYDVPRRTLEGRGVSVVTASVAPGPCRGKLGMIAKADIALADASAGDIDAIVFVGGGGSALFFDDYYAHQIAREFFESGKIVAAICIAPSVLARAGLLEGKKATAFPTQDRDLEEHGAVYTGAPVEVDGAIITANGPEAAGAFGEAIADAMGLGG